MYFRSAILLLLSLATCEASLQVVPGATWTVTNKQQHVQAHGGGIIKDGGKYYLIGEDRTKGSLFQGVNCYSSSNLVEWTYVNTLLDKSHGGDLGPGRVVERPKVLYNSKTSTYVMYLHIDDSSYKEAKVGVATSKSVCGRYNYIGSFNPLGHESRDMGLFQDTDGKAYLLSEDRPNGLRINALSDDYLNVTSTVYMFPDHYEAPAILKQNGYYFMFGSQLTGFDTNDNLYSYAQSLAGPWSKWATFADVGSHTYNSQTTYILPLGSSAIYMGDRWVPSFLESSTYVWLPLSISGTKVTMANRQSWVPNVGSGSWSAAPSSTIYEGEAGTFSSGAKAVSCSGCSGSSAAGYLGGTSHGKVTFATVQSSSSTKSTILVSFANGDSTERYATVTVNGVDQTLVFLPSSGGGQTPGLSSLTTSLRSGANNIQFGGTGDLYSADVDYIKVPSS